MVDTIKISEMTDGGDIKNDDITAGLRDGGNRKFNNPWLFLPPGTTAERPAPDAAMFFRQRWNTTLESYEYFNPEPSPDGIWVQIQDSDDIAFLIARLAAHTVGDGASMIGLEDQTGVVSKTVQDMADATFIAQTDNGTLTNAQFMGDLDTGITRNTTTTGVQSVLTGSSTITAVINDDTMATAATTNMSTSLAIKNYVDGLDVGNVKSVTGTANEIDVDNTDAQNPVLSLSATLDFPGDFTVQSSTVIDEIIDDDTFATATDSNLATAESIKEYVDNAIGSAAGGTDGQIQYNDNGLFGGDTVTTDGSGNWTGTLSLTGQLHIDNLRADGNTISSTDTNGDLILTPNGTGDLVLDVLNWPQADGTNGQVIVTNGSGQLSFVTPSSGSGTVNAGTENELAYYAANGTAVSGLTVVNDAVLTTSATGVPTWIDLDDGEIVVGSSAGAPAAATLTPGTGISIANGANSITISTTGTSFAVATVAGTSQAAAVNTMYILLNAGQTSVDLPATCSVGDTIIIVGSTANVGGWIVDAPAGDTVMFNGTATSAGGTITSSALAGQTMEIVCDVADTSWIVVDSVNTTLTTA
jgi:hypothetical protein